MQRNAVLSYNRRKLQLKTKKIKYFQFFHFWELIFILNNFVYINFSLEIVLHLWKSCKDTTEISLYPSFPTTHILCSHDTFIESKELMSVQVCFSDNPRYAIHPHENSGLGKNRLWNNRCTNPVFRSDCARRGFLYKRFRKLHLAELL